MNNMCAKTNKTLRFMRRNIKIGTWKIMKRVHLYKTMILSTPLLLRTPIPSTYLRHWNGPTQRCYLHSQPALAQHVYCGGNAGNTRMTNSTTASASCSPHHAVQDHQCQWPSKVASYVTCLDIDVQAVEDEAITWSTKGFSAILTTS